jgi:hypothetical protein
MNPDTNFTSPSFPIRSIHFSFLFLFHVRLRTKERNTTLSENREKKGGTFPDDRSYSHFFSLTTLDTTVSRQHYLEQRIFILSFSRKSHFSSIYQNKSNSYSRLCVQIKVVFNGKIGILKPAINQYNGDQQFQHQHVHFVIKLSSQLKKSSVLGKSFINFVLNAVSFFLLIILLSFFFL